MDDVIPTGGGVNPFYSSLSDHRNYALSCSALRRVNHLLDAARSFNNSDTTALWPKRKQLPERLSMQKRRALRAFIRNRKKEERNNTGVGFSQLNTLKPESEKDVNKRNQFMGCGPSNRRDT